MKALLAVVAFFVSLFGFGKAPTTAPTQNAPPNQALVVFSDAGFKPQTIEVASGTKVVWENLGGVDVSINSDPHPFHTNHDPLNIGVITAGQTKYLIFDKPGTYDYHNHLNSGQTGTIVVK